MIMAVCKACGSDTPENFKFCPICGIPLTFTEDAAPASSAAEPEAVEIQHSLLSEVPAESSPDEPAEAEATTVEAVTLQPELNTTVEEQAQIEEPEEQPEPLPAPEEQPEPLPAPEEQPEPLPAPEEQPEPLPAPAYVFTPPVQPLQPVPPVTPLQPDAQALPPPPYNPPLVPGSPAGADVRPPRGSSYAMVGTFSYIGLIILYAIPVLGWIFCVVMAFAARNRNIRNYARAQFILSLVVIALAILGYIYLAWIFRDFWDFISGFIVW